MKFIAIPVVLILSALAVYKNSQAPKSQIITVNATDPCGRLIVGPPAGNDGFVPVPQCPQRPSQLELRTSAGTVTQVGFAAWEVLLPPGQAQNSNLVLTIHTVGSSPTKWQSEQTIKTNQPRTHTLVQLRLEE